MDVGGYGGSEVAVADLQFHRSLEHLCSKENGQCRDPQAQPA